jgi:PAS domain S-box-containing protein
MMLLSLPCWWISFGCLAALAAPLPTGFTIAVLLALLLSGAVGFAWRVSARSQRRNVEALQRRVGDLERKLHVQERRVEQLTNFAVQVQESEAGTRAIIDNALDGIITVDYRGCIIELNPAAEKMFGLFREEVLGRRVGDCIVPPSLREPHRRGLDRFLETGESSLIGRRVETIGLHADGREFPIELTIAVLHASQPPLLTAYLRDLSQLKDTSAKLAQSSARLQAVLDAATEVAIIATDPDGTITLFNRGAERMLGYKAEEIVGEHTPELLHAAAEVTAHARQLTEEFGVPLEGFAALVERARCGDHEEREWTFLRKDGSSLTVNLALTAIRDNTGAITGYLAVAVDVTGRRRASLALERAKEAAEAANRAKSDFLANISHEIRTPMNGILGMTQLALDTELTTEQREYLELVKASAEGLLTVINDILDFSKIEAGKLELDPVEFELRDVAADTLRSLSLRANAKALELACDIPAAVPDFLIGDPDRLRQILLNLVGNAIKFTERGEVVVRVRLASARECAAEEKPPAPLQPGGDIVLHFAVSDTGIGIDPQTLPYIFDPFVQADSSTTRKHGGTGLGLTITGRLVEMMNGRLWAESVPGQGSTFRFTLHFQLQDLSPSRLLPRRPLDLQGVSALVVDDNATNRRILEELLASWLMEPATADGGRSALDLLEAGAKEGKYYPLVLLDAHLPEQDGFALAAEIRARPHLKSPALLMLSSANRAGDGEKCRELGIGQRLCKPLKPSDLLDAILRLLEPAEADASPCPQASAVALAPSSGECIEVAEDTGELRQAPVQSLRVLLAEDNLVNQRLMLAVLEKQGHRVVTVASGAAAVRAVQQETFDLVLMDVQMPEMNGLDATRAIRAWERERGGHMPIVATTAHAMKGVREDCLRAGMDDYLSKPVQVPALVHVLQEWTRDAKQPAPTDAPPVLFDPGPLMQRISDDVDLFRELVGMFQEDVPRLLRQVHATIVAGDAEGVERTAHLLKGTASNFHATEVVRAAQHLEDMGCQGALGESAGAYQRLEESLSAFSAALDEWSQAHPAGSLL